MARPESRFCVDIVKLLLDKMLFDHAEQSELKLLSISKTFYISLLVLDILLRHVEQWLF